jgi:hypothetical protein
MENGLGGLGGVMGWSSVGGGGLGASALFSSLPAVCTADGAFTNRDVDQYSRTRCGNSAGLVRNGGNWLSNSSIGGHSKPLLAEKPRQCLSLFI